jgi:hypothetical protein
MKSTVLGLMFVSMGVQANWTEDLATGPSQFNGDGGTLPVIVGSVPDPVGDAFGSGTPNLDVSGMSAFLAGGNVSISMDFATPISPGDAGNPDSVIGFIELDTDQNPLTGNAPAFDVFCPQPTELGTEFIINLGSVAAGQVGIEDASLGPVGTAPISFTATGFTVDLPLSLIGNPANMHIASVIGTFGEPTDCVPDAALLAAGVPSIPVPTLSQWMLVLMALLMLVFTTRSVRRDQ